MPSFPHLTVAQNIAYGLPKKRDRKARVDEVLELVGLVDLGVRIAPPAIRRTAAADRAGPRARTQAGGYSPRRALQQPRSVDARVGS